MINQLLDKARDWLARGTRENEADMAAAKTAAKRTELRRMLDEITSRERQRDEMLAHRSTIQAEIDGAVERHAKVTKPIQAALEKESDASRRVELRQQVNSANAALEAELKEINGRLEAAEREYQYLAVRCAHRSTIEAQLFRSAPSQLRVELEAHGGVAQWRDQKLKELRKRLSEVKQESGSSQLPQQDRERAAHVCSVIERQAALITEHGKGESEVIAEIQDKILSGC